MKTGKKYEKILGSRKDYFVEYYPCENDQLFAALNLVFVKESDKNDVVDAIENELKHWLTRYPIPLFISAFDEKGDLIRLDGIKPSDHLIGFFDQNQKICLHWRLLKDEEIPKIALDREYVDNLYSNLHFKTYSDLDVERRKRRKQIKIGWFIFFIWLVVVPALIAILENYNYWISFLAMVFSLYKAVQKGLELTGKLPKSKKVKAKEIEDQLKDHYSYHCQLNPEGFDRLKRDNFEKMGIDEITKEARSLKMNLD